MHSEKDYILHYHSQICCPEMVIYASHTEKIGQAGNLKGQPDEGGER